MGSAALQRHMRLSLSKPSAHVMHGGTQNECKDAELVKICSEAKLRKQCMYTLRDLSFGKR